MNKNKKVILVVLIIVLIPIIFITIILGKEAYIEFTETPGSPYDRVWEEDKRIKLKTKESDEVIDLLEEVTEYVRKYEGVDSLKSVEIRIHKENNQITRYIFSYNLPSIENYQGVLRVHISPDHGHWEITVGNVNYMKIELRGEYLTLADAQELIRKGIQYIKDNNYLDGDGCDLSFSAQYAFITVLFGENGRNGISDGPQFNIESKEGELFFKEILSKKK